MKFSSSLLWTIAFLISLPTTTVAQAVSVYKATIPTADKNLFFSTFRNLQGPALGDTARSKYEATGFVDNTYFGIVTIRDRNIRWSVGTLYGGVGNSIASAPEDQRVAFAIKDGTECTSGSFCDLTFTTAAGITVRNTQFDCSNVVPGCTKDCSTGVMPTACMITTPVPPPSPLPTMLPTIAPPTAPSPTPLPTFPPFLPTAPPVPGRAICYSGASTVIVKDVGSIPMSELKVGDLVFTGNDTKYEKVYAFGHFGPNQMGEFVKIDTTVEESSSIEISANHMILTMHGGFVRASMVAAGDELVGDQGENIIVKSVGKTTSTTGVYAPFTPSGKISVNGILGSSYVAMGEASSLPLGFSFQWVAHAFQFPHRIICYYLGSCSNPSYTTDGLSTWVAAPYQLGQWLAVVDDEDDQNMLKTGVWICSFAILGIFSVVEAFLSNFWLMMILGFAGGMMTLVRRTKL